MKSPSEILGNPLDKKSTIMNKNYLVYQLVIKEETSSIINGAVNNNICTEIFIRKVSGNNKEEAIGKFLLDTQKETFKRRIEPIECLEFETLKYI